MVIGGAPLIHDYAEDAPQGAIICAHASGDPMTNGLYTSFRSDRTTGGGIPSFWVGDIKTSTSNAMLNLLAQPAIAGVDYKYSVDGTTMKVDVKVKFFNSGQGDYYLSVIVLEDGIDGTGDFDQNGAPATYHHDFVLRESSVPGNAYGEMIVTDPVAGKVIEKNYTIDLDASWDDVYPVCIIWKKDVAGQHPYYKFINSLKKK